MRWPSVLLAIPIAAGLPMILMAACGTNGIGVDDGANSGGIGGTTFTGGTNGAGTLTGSGTGTAAGGANGTSTGAGSLTTGTGLFNPDGGEGGISECVPKTCVELGTNCGPMGDGCGNVIECGNCKSPETCGGAGKPSVCGGDNKCVPTTCVAQAATCGPIGDGCGNVLQCGNCVAPETCGGGGKPSVCGGNNLCVSTTCAQQAVDCGPIGDGCGGLIQCGSCMSPASCGGGGVPSVCGLPPVPDGGNPCTPTSCASQNINCGPTGDGCGNQLDCGVCAAPQTCGGGGKPSVCGGNSGCAPLTCLSQGLNCGAAGDGCGNQLSCGTCTAPKTCGGGGVPGVCGGSNNCVAKTCAQLGLNCGPAGDGCGGLLNCGNGCPGIEICGGGGQPGVCGPADAGAGSCTGLCLQQVTCPGKNVTTTISGTVLAPNGLDPIYNALVFVPNAPVAAFTPGVACEQCGLGVSGSPLISATTGPDGTFQLQNVPVGTNIPVVIQLGRWRRQLVIPTVTACVNTAPAAPFFRLPRNKGEGDIPLMAMVTGNADPLECVLRKIGIDDAEFTNPTANGGTGRVQFYVSNGSTSATGNAPSVTQLTGSQATLNQYDMVILSCDGTPGVANPPTAANPNNAVAANQTELINYANAGGRVFATHYSYVWLDNDAPFSGTATWDVGQGAPPDPLTGFVDFTNPKGQAFAQWMQIAGASTTYGQVTLNVTRHDFDAVNAAEGQQWLYWKNGGTNTPLHYTFNTPVGATPANQCGRALFSDFHVNTGAGTGDYPTECPALGTALTPQEHLLEFMLFNLASCITPNIPPPPPTCTPLTCMQQGFNCGPAGDGCGNLLACGSCGLGQTCGGGGMPGVCGGTPCVSETCAGQGIQCGPAGDGCGNLLQCGNCPNGETCGGGGMPGKCGKAVCNPDSCVAQGIQCGPAGDGCGNLLQCGNCPNGETCGGGGVPGKCGAPDSGACVPITCGDQKIMCGPAGDGCGGQLDCGPCPVGQTCGGGGVPGVCGGTVCLPETCAKLGVMCGPAGDGCGGLLQCGPCPVGETCGGNGVPGVCGTSCVPLTCAGLKLMCGPAGDGCGGLLECGDCVLPETCGGGGVSGVCGQPHLN